MWTSTRTGSNHLPSAVLSDIRNPGTKSPAHKPSAVYTEHVPRTVRLSVVAALLLIASLLWQSAPAHALAPRPLTDGDFFSVSSGTGVVGDLSIDGEHYKGGLAVAFNRVWDNPARVSIAAHSLVGYNAMVIKVGFLDESVGDTAQR